MVRSRTGRPSRPDAPFCQPLESRLALSASVIGDTLVIVGSPVADIITIAPGAENGIAVLTGVPGVPDGTEFTGFERISVDLKSGNDVFSQTGELTNAVGFACDMTVLGGNGNDTISVQQDHAQIQIRGGNAHDTINGGPANELLKGGRGRDIIFGNAGHDILHGQLGKDILIGGSGNDTLLGGPQADELWGNSGSDTLNGGTQRDTLWGGGDTDLVTGGLHRDTFHCAPDEALDFNNQDVNFSSVFSTTGHAVLLGQTFWNRVAEGEVSGHGRLSATAQTAVVIQAIAFSNVATPFDALFQAVDALSPTQRLTLQNALLVVTNSFSPDIVANPDSLTFLVMGNFRDDLIDAAQAANAAIAPAYAGAINAYVDECFTVSPGIVFAVNELPADEPETHGVLYAMDSTFGLHFGF